MCSPSVSCSRLAQRVSAVGTHEVHLTPIEYKLLTVLVHYAGRVVTQRKFLQEVWDPTNQCHELCSIYMGQLRHNWRQPDAPTLPCD